MSKVTQLVRGELGFEQKCVLLQSLYFYLPVAVGRQLSMCLCVSACLVSGYWLLFGIIFSKLFAWQIALEESNDVSFQSKG